MIRFTTRSFAVLVLSLALLSALAAPTLAAPGGNSAAAAACENGGYLHYTDAAYNSFKNEGQCTRYAAQGGVLTPVAVASFLSAESVQVGAYFATTVTGAGLLPGATVTVTGTLLGGGSIGPVDLGTVSSTGTVNLGPFMSQCGLVTSQVIATLDSNGHVIEDLDPAPC
jgi:hypothetical protein